MNIFSSASKTRRRFNNSLRHKFAVIFSSTLLVMMVILTSLLYEQEQNFLYQSSIKQTRILADTLASSSASWILSHDVVGLAEVFQGIEHTPDLTRAYILSLSGEVLASTKSDEIGLFVDDDLSQQLLKSPPSAQILLANHFQIDVATPIFSGSRHIAWARIEMGTTSIIVNLQSVLVRGIYIILGASLLVICFALFLAQMLTQRLNELVEIFTSVTQGRRDSRAKISSNDDEVGLLAKGFNEMLDELVTTEYQREQITRFYSAWIACNNVITHENQDEESLLNKICHVIAEQVGFKLVWIGVINIETGCVNTIASNHLDSLYLKNLNFSNEIEIQTECHEISLEHIMRSKQPIIFNDLRQEQEIALYWNMTREEGTLALATFPLTRGEQIIGTMCLHSTELNHFTPELITLIKGLTEDISYAMENLARTKLQIIQDNELRIAAAAFESQESFMVTDVNSVILRVNNAFTAITGYTANEVIGKNPRVLSSGRHTKEFYDTMWESLVTHHFWQGEIWNRKKNGYIFPEWLCITAISNSAGEIVNYVATSNDISQRKADEERIRQLAFYDELTKLPNRALLFQRLNLALNTSQRYHQHGALIFLDLDHFKTINDTLGHTLGDQLLLEVAKRLNQCVRNIDTVARLGGDEFIVILEHLDSDELAATIQVYAIAEKIRASIAECYLLNVDIFDDEAVSTIEYYSSCSIGFVLFSGIGVSAEDLLKYADLAMYHAKKMGRNHISVFAPEMQQALIKRTQLEADLRSSILNGNEFVLYYQAQVDGQGHVLGAEALIRWNHPLRGRVNPVDFIPLAEETGMIIAIGTWVLQKGCETLIDWAKNPKMAHLKLAINVSSRQLAQENFVAQVAQILAKTQVNPQNLKLEITESMLLNNLNDVIEKMHALKKLGISFSMDDFGTGYSSLSYLQRLPIDQLKIDQSFVQNLSFDGNDGAIVKTILNLGENLSLNIIAEGVETETQCNYLSSFGCLMFQGYLFSRPLSETDFMKLIISKDVKNEF